MARPSRPAGGVAIGGPSAASSRTPRPVTQAEGGGRPSSPPSRASGVSSSSLPSPFPSLSLLPSSCAPRFVSVVSRAGRRGWPELALSRH